MTNSDAAFFDIVKKNNFVALLKLKHINYVMMPNEKSSKLTELLCTVYNKFCSIADYAFANFHPETDNLKRFNVFVGHYPDATSTMVLEHW